MIFAAYQRGWELADFTCNGAYDKLLVRFVDRKTLIFEVTIENGQDCRLPLQYCSASNTWKLTTSETSEVSNWHYVLLIVRFGGDIPHLHSIQLSSPTAGTSEVYLETQSLESSPLGEESWNRSGGFITFDRQVNRETSREAHTRRTTELKEFSDAYRFFLDLDCKFQSTDDATQKWVSASLGLLTSGIKARATCASGFGRPGAHPWAITPRSIEKAEELHAHLSQASGSLVKLANQHFGADADEDAVDRFGHAFELFATNRLHLTARGFPVVQTGAIDGAPDGPNFFLFTELALSCIWNRIDQSFWQDRLHRLVAASHVYAQHAPAGRGHDIERPGALQFFAGRYFSRVRVNRIRSLHLKGASIEEHAVAFSCILGQSFPESNYGIWANSESYGGCNQPVDLNFPGFRESVREDSAAQTDVRVVRIR